MNRSRFKVEAKKAKFETPFLIFNLTSAMAVAKDNELEIHVRCALLNDFKAGLKACESHQRIKEAFGEIVGVSTVRRWFHKFKEGDFELNDRQRSDDEEMRQNVEADPRHTASRR